MLEVIAGAILSARRIGAASAPLAVSSGETFFCLKLMPGLIFSLGGKLDPSYGGALKTAKSMAHHAGKEIASEFGNTLKGTALGFAGVYSIEQAFHKTIEAAKELVITSKRLDIPIEQLQVLRRAAEDANVEFGTLATAFDKINLARAKALGGDLGIQNSFAALGVTLDNLRSMSVQELFTGPMSATVSKLDPQLIASQLNDVFGKGFGQFIPVMQNDFAELGESMKKAGAIMDEKVAVKLEAIANEFEIVGQIITSQLAPALLAFSEWAYKMALKGGGKVAGAAGFWGGVYQNMIDAPNQAGFEEHGGRNFWKQLWYQIFENKGQTSPLRALDSAEKPFDDAAKELDEKLKRAAEALKKPIPHDFKTIEDDAKVKQAAAIHRETGFVTERERIGLGAASSIQVSMLDVQKRMHGEQIKTNARLDRVIQTLDEGGF